MAHVGLLLLHIALALGSAAGEADDTSSFRCYLPKVFNETDESDFENATENASNLLDVRGCNTSMGPLTAAECFLRCVEGHVLAEAGPSLARRGWAVCPEEGGVFRTPECIPDPNTVLVDALTVRWYVPKDPVHSLTCDGCSMAVSPDGQLLLLARTPVEVWDVQNLTLLGSLNNSSASYVAIAGGGTWAFTFSALEGDNNTLTIGKWALDDFSHPVWEHRVDWFTPDCPYPLVSPDGESMAFACNGSLGLFDVASGSITERAPVPLEDTAMKIDSLVTAGTWFAGVVYGETGAALWVWSPSRWSPSGTTQFRRWSPEDSGPGTKAATHDGRHILLGAEGGVYMYTVWTGERVASFTTGIRPSWATGMTVSQDDEWIWAVVAVNEHSSVEQVALWNTRIGIRGPVLIHKLPNVEQDPQPQALLTLDGRLGFVIAGNSVFAYKLQLRPTRPSARFQVEDMIQTNALYYFGVGPSRAEDEYAFLASATVADGSGGERDAIVSHGLSLRTRSETVARAPADPSCVPTGTVESRSSSGWLLCRKLSSSFAWANTVRLRNVFTGRMWNITVGFNISAAALTPIGTQLFVLGGQQRGARTLAAWALLGDGPSPSGMWTLPTPDRYGDLVDIQAGPSGKLVVIILYNRTMQWELQPDHARLLCTYDWSEKIFTQLGPCGAALGDAFDHGEPCRALLRLPRVVIAPDEAEMLRYSSDGRQIEAWSLRSCLQEPLTRYDDHDWDLISLQDPHEFKISPDGNWVTLPVERMVFFWDRHTSNSGPELKWVPPMRILEASASLDGAWAIIAHGLGVDVWPIFPSSAYDRALKEAKVDGIHFDPASRTTQTPIRVPSWLDATSLLTFDLHNATVTDFDWQVPRTLVHMNLSGTRAQRGGLKLRPAWLQTMGMAVDLRGVPDVDVGELANNPRFQRDLSSCATGFVARGLCLRRQHGERVRRYADGRVCSSAFAVWEADGDGGALIKWADVYADAASLNRWLCDCREGTYGDGDVCTPCPQDSFCPVPRPDTAQAANEMANPCATGSGTNGVGGLTSNASCLCRPGWRSVGLGGVAPCQPCQDGFAEGWGKDACGPCGFGRLPNGGRDGCDLHWNYIAALGALATLSACVALACPLACGRGVPLAEVALEDGRVVLTTTRNHRFLHRAAAAFDVHIHGTGSPGLDRPDKGPFKVRILSSKRLLLLDQQGACIAAPSDAAPLEASQGWVCVRVPRAFFALGVAGIPAGVVVLVLLALWASSAAALMLLEPSSPNLTVVAVVLGMAAALGYVKHWHWQRAAARSTLRGEIEKFRERILNQNPHPRACLRGPGRAVTMGQLDDLHRAFQAFIRDTRTMYYLWENVLKPITAPEKLSYAELVGPSIVEWFCSHFWGTPFAHFAESVRKHAEAVGKREGGRDARLMSYWICSLSNNQWDIAEEIPRQWQESSFYLALCSGHCRGTTMILDEKAKPLTRSWCLFEVLQTLRLSRQDERFEGLLLCTSTGVLNYGEARLDVAMAIADRLLELDLREATASKAEDKAMIDDLVVRDFGGFVVVNDFVRGRIRKALRTMRGRVDQDLSRLDLALAGAPDHGDPSPRRQPALPTLLAPGPSDLGGAGRPAGPLAKEGPPLGLGPDELVDV